MGTMIESVNGLLNKRERKSSIKDHSIAIALTQKPDWCFPVQVDLVAIVSCLHYVLQLLCNCVSVLHQCFLVLGEEREKKERKKEGTFGWLQPRHS